MSDFKATKGQGCIVAARRDERKIRQGHGHVKPSRNTKHTCLQEEMTEVYAALRIGFPSDLRRYRRSCASSYSSACRNTNKTNGQSNRTKHNQLSKDAGHPHRRKRSQVRGNRYALAAGGLLFWTTVSEGRERVPPVEMGSGKTKLSEGCLGSISASSRPNHPKGEEGAR